MHWAPKYVPQQGIKVRCSGYLQATRQHHSRSRYFLVTARSFQSMPAKADSIRVMKMNSGKKRAKVELIHPRKKSKLSSALGQCRRGTDQIVKLYTVSSSWASRISRKSPACASTNRTSSMHLVISLTKEQKRIFNTLTTKLVNFRSHIFIRFICRQVSLEIFYFVCSKFFHLSSIAWNRGVDIFFRHFVRNESRHRWKKNLYESLTAQ